MPRIPFNKPTIEGREVDYVRDAVTSGHTSAGGPFSRDVATLLANELDAADVLLTTSCTDALEMSSLLLDIGPGDTVIVPSFTFVSTALAFARAGARIKFADIDPDTLGISARHVSRLLDDSVRAVVPVHYAGIACDLAGLFNALDGSSVEVVEDNAHGLFARYGNRPLGSFGRFATLSFHETKNFVCGEGGALVVNRPEDVDRAHVILDKGTNRRAFMLGDVDKYTWVDTGSSFGLSDMLAAYLMGQLEQRTSIMASRQRVFDTYMDTLRPLADEYELGLPHVPNDRTCAYHMFYVLLPSREQRDAVLADLRTEGVHGTFHYVPLHRSEAGRRVSVDQDDCPVTDDVAGRLLRLPFHNALSTTEQDQVVSIFSRSVKHRC